MQIVTTKGSVYGRILDRALQMDKGRQTVKRYLEELGAFIALWTDELVGYYERVVSKPGVGIAITAALFLSIVITIAAITRGNAVLSAGAGVLATGTLILLLAWIRRRYLG